MKPNGERLLTTAAPSLRQLLEIVSGLARKREQQVWAVGGVVRDLLSGASAKDIDLVVLGDVERFAAELASIVGGEPRSHRRFLTVDFRSESGFDIDVVRARAEYYPKVAGLPVVRPGTLVEDLRRRDFAVNAIALPLTGDRGHVLDPFDGVVDLESRKLRVLHDRSFAEDPTRMLRGLRLADRLGLELESRTARLAREAVDGGALKALSRERLRGELVPLLKSPGATRRSLPRLNVLGLGRALFPGVAMTEIVGSRLAALENRAGELGGDDQVWLATLIGIHWEADRSALESTCDRLAIGGESRKRLIGLPERVKKAGRDLDRLNSPYELYRLGESLGGFGRCLAACFGTPELADFLVEQWPRLELRRPRISGEDLIGLGFEPGVWIGDCLEATIRARLEERIGSGEELAFAASWLRSRRATETAPDPGPDDPAHDSGGGSSR